MSNEIEAIARGLSEARERVMSVLSFPSLPGQTLATIEIVRQPDGSIGARLIDMAIGEIESRETVSERFDAVINWLGPVVESLKQQSKDFRP